MVEPSMKLDPIGITDLLKLVLLELVARVIGPSSISSVVATVFGMRIVTSKKFESTVP